MTALVLGANGLIGRAIVRALAARHDLFIAGRDAAGLDLMVAELTGTSVTAVPLDATDDEALRHLVERVAATPTGLEVAVNNVGLSHRPTPLADLDLAEFDRVLAVTLRSVAVAMHLELAAMQRCESAHRAVVNVASSAGTSGVPGMSAYVAAKHGVVGLTRTAALDYGPQGIRVNAVAPGPIESGPIMKLDPAVREQVGRHVPMRRMGRAQEVAEAVSWLASPSASFVTGVILGVDGGKSA